jgi:hypothetical protein
MGYSWQRPLFVQSVNYCLQPLETVISSFVSTYRGRMLFSQYIVLIVRHLAYIVDIIVDYQFSADPAFLSSSETPSL